MTIEFKISRMSVALFLVLNISAAEVLDPAKPDGGNDEWRMRHGERVADVRSNADKLEVLFIGDSITGGWLNIGKAVWEKEWVPLHAVNIGIAGSQTANILWQFENGAIDGIHPRVAVLMIGVNNVMAAPDQSAADIAGGVSTIVSRLREKLPNTRILLLGTFPKDKVPGTPDRRKIQEINALSAKLDDGKWIRFLDIRSQLLDKDGNLNADVSPDGVHLTIKGYQIWADAIRPVVCEMMASSHGFLTPESLAMPRRQIALKGTDLRLFNARGSVTFRERTVTGIDELFIAPRAVSRVAVSFNLSFREETLGALIEDNQDEWGEGTLNVLQHWNPANKELGIYKGWGDALILPSQRATWAPDAYTRRGTFHHYLGKDLISFGVISRTVPAADVDGAYEAKRMLTAFLFAGGVFNSTWLSAKGGGGGFYMQSPFALLDIAQRYMRQTGNRTLLDEKAGSKNVFEHFRDGAQTLLDSYVKDGLIDAGEGTGKLLEIRTSGYEHTVAAINGMAVDYLQQVADWCRQRGDAKADAFQAAARRLHDEIERRLWDESAGWYINLYPDGSRHRVMSYHVFDLLRQPSLPEARRRRLARHIVAGEFLGPYGMYSIALSDEEHWEMQDCDWGGGGQYVGQSLRIAESLYRMEEPERAWDVLSRCLLWVDRFPYFPQTIYAEELAMQDHERGWSLQISAGAGAQAIIHGVFGLMPQDDGRLVVRPHYNKSLDTATLKGYRFRDHLYDLRMDPKTFQVCRDGVRLTEERHGTYITITEQGSVLRGP